MKNQSGFTLIELLIVIAIIGLIASIVLVSVNSARENAAVSSIISNLKQVEKALFLLADDESISLWWPESNFGFGSNPDIAEIITDTNRLGKFLNVSPNLSIGTNMGYDNDQDIFVCGDGGVVYRGVNIHIRNIPFEIAQKVSQIVDGNTDLNCGQVKWHPSVNGSLFYVISEDYQNY